MAGLRNQIAAVQQALGDDAANFAFHLTPMAGGPDTPDEVIFAVFDDTAHWARSQMALQSSAEGQALMQMGQSVVDCDMSLWWGEQVVAASDE